MDTRVGYPSEHLAGDTPETVSSPLFATAVGLLMNALEQHPTDHEVVEEIEKIAEENSVKAPLAPKVHKKRKSILDRFGEK